MSDVQRRARSATALMWYVCAVVVLASAFSKAHPHDEPEIFDVKGTLTKVDLVNRFIEVDTVDNKTKAPRNLLLFLDRKVKIRNGKTRVELQELQRGQRVTCTVEREHPGGAERLTVFYIRLDARG